MTKRLDSNPHCPVLGCRALRPHADEPLTAPVIAEFQSPERLALSALRAMTELRDSILRDLAERRFFAWYTRLRQPEELYIQTLYALLIADEKELHHLLSGERPNGLAAMYRRVNTAVFEGRGPLYRPPRSPGAGAMAPIDTLNDGAHAAFPGLFICFVGPREDQEFPSPAFNQRYSEHLDAYCARVEYMYNMFRSQRSREDVLGGMTNIHRPASYWEEQKKRTQSG